MTETQKTVARVHALDKTLLEGLWRQGVDKTVSQEGLILKAGPGTATLPDRLNLSESSGFTLDVWLTLSDLSDGQPLIDSRDASGRGIALVTTERGAVRITFSDGKTEAAWDCDPGLLKPHHRHHVVAIVDAGPRIITFVVDGQLCDGGDARQYGWGRFEKPLSDVSGTGRVRIAPSVESLRIYGRYLRTSEAIGAFHAS